MHVLSLGVHATVYYRHVLRLLPRMGGRFLKRLRMDRVLDRGNDRPTALRGTRTPGRLRLPRSKTSPAVSAPKPGRRRRPPGLGVRAGGLARSNNNLAARRQGCHASGDRPGRMPASRPESASFRINSRAFLHAVPRPRLPSALSPFPAGPASLSRTFPRRPPPCARALPGRTPSRHGDGTHLRTGRGHSPSLPGSTATGKRSRINARACTYAPPTIIVLRAVHVIKSGSPQEGLLPPRPAPSPPPGHSFPKRNTE